jgi:hypothetical protein
MSLNQRLVDPAGDEWLQNRPFSGGTECVEPPIMEIGDPRGEAEPQ